MSMRKLIMMTQILSIGSSLIPKNDLNIHDDVPALPIRDKFKPDKEPKMKLTQEEKDKLSSLDGKAKKKYLKQLKREYGV